MQIRFIIMLSIVVMLTTCVDESCNRGNISIQMNKSGDIVKNNGYLPDDFPYTIEQFLGSVIGEWVNSETGENFEIFASESLVISYNLYEESKKCGPTVCSSEIILNPKSNQTGAFRCILTMYESVCNGVIEVLGDNSNYELQILCDADSQSYITGDCAIIKLQGNQILTKIK